MRRIGTWVIVLLVLVLAVWWPQRDGRRAARRVLAADESLQWYRGNIHTHTLWSDGDDYPEMVALWYRDRQYDFLCFTDHNTLLAGERWIDVEKSKGGRRAYDKLKARFRKRWVDERVSDDGKLEVQLKTFDQVSRRLSRPGKFLLIQGEEISDTFQNRPIHMNASNVKELLPPMGGESVYDVMQRNTDALIAQRERTNQPMLIHLNHPNFGFAVRAEDLMRVRGENFFEVYNGHPSVGNLGDALRPGTERIWDIILTFRIAELGLPVMYGLAVDDGHSYHDMPSRASEPGRGWVMVLADGLNPASLIDALERGRFFASSGVNLKQVVSSTDGLEIEVAAEPGIDYKIEFIGTRRGYPRESAPVLDAQGNEVWTTRKYSDQIGLVMKTVTGSSARYDFEPDDLYVRARITSSRRHPNPSAPGDFEQAWSQPVLGPAAPPAP
ncbi:MAG: hypothetical protein EHM42_02920 [Planctomycetaceae bacterium]|nr:MAG: hypothetical protein EHM42_02920 [Planctomycetaceae bacterium]